MEIIKNPVDIELFRMVYFQMFDSEVGENVLNDCANEFLGVAVDLGDVIRWRMDRIWF